LHRNNNGIGGSMANLPTANPSKGSNGGEYQTLRHDFIHLMTELSNDK